MMYRLASPWPGSVEQVEVALEDARFVECSASQEKSVGWIEPRGHAHGALVEVVAGQWLLKLMLEVKVVPGSVVKRKVQDQLDQIEATTGRKPGKKEKREISEDDLTTAFYAEDQIDLGQLVMEQFHLALPMKPLCSEACRGLCPQCGTNLNTGSCECDSRWEDPRLAALKALKDSKK